MIWNTLSIPRNGVGAWWQLRHCRIVAPNGVPITPFNYYPGYSRTCYRERYTLLRSIFSWASLISLNLLSRSLLYLLRCSLARPLGLLLHRLPSRSGKQSRACTMGYPTSVVSQKSAEDASSMAPETATPATIRRGWSAVGVCSVCLILRRGLDARE